jgi:hypothetical protein
VGRRRRCSSGNYSFLSVKGIESRQLGTGFFLHHRIVPEVKRVEFVSDRMSYIVLASLWCDIGMIARAPAGDEGYDSRDIFYEIFKTAVRSLS